MVNKGVVLPNKWEMNREIEDLKHEIRVILSDSSLTCEEKLNSLYRIVT